MGFIGLGDANPFSARRHSKFARKDIGSSRELLFDSGVFTKK